MALTLSSLVTNVKPLRFHKKHNCRLAGVWPECRRREWGFLPVSSRQLCLLRQLFLHHPCFVFVYRDDFSWQRILGPRSWMLLLRRSVQARSKTVLLLFVSKMAFQRSSCGNRIPKFSVWVHVDFLGALAAWLLYLRLLYPLPGKVYEYATDPSRKLVLISLLY